MKYGKHLIPILCKDFNSYTVGWKCMSSDIGVMLSDHLPDQVKQLKKIKFQKLRSVAMATIPLKTWSWRGHSSVQNLLFFQVIKIKLVVNEGTLSIHVS